MDGIEKSKLNAMDKSMPDCIPTSIASMDGIEKSKLKAMGKSMPEMVYPSRGSHRKMYTVKSDNIFLTGPRADDIHVATCRCRQ